MGAVRAATRRVVLEVLGWILVLAGVAALVLPGPGLLLLFAGLAVLSQQYDWAERRMQPVRKAALRAAHDGVRTWPRVALSAAAALGLVGLGVLWGVSPDSPSWWPVDDRWWLTGGWATGATLIASGVLALALLAYSFRRYRPR